MLLNLSVSSNTLICKLNMLPTSQLFEGVFASRFHSGTQDKDFLSNNYVFPYMKFRCFQKVTWKLEQREYMHGAS